MRILKYWHEQIQWKTSITVISSANHIHYFLSRRFNYIAKGQNTYKTFFFNVKVCLVYATCENLLSHYFIL